MPIKVDIRSDFPRTCGRAVYRQSEFGLAYDGSAASSDFHRKNLSQSIDQQFGIASGNLFVTVDTLTLVFSERDARFVSLDAYTNCERWAKAVKTKPSNAETGTLVLAESIDDRISVDIVPAYSFSENESTLYIGLGAQASRYFDVGQDIIVGLANRILVEVVLTNLRREK
jgi:hypothetical protein